VSPEQVGNVVSSGVEWLTVADERAICIERYDRIRAADDHVLRVHQEDLCQALHIHPDVKYENESGPSVAAIGALLSRYVAGAAGPQSRMRFAEALALNWLIAGPDAHAKLPSAAPPWPDA